MENNKKKINVFEDIKDIDNATIKIGRGLDSVLGLLQAMQKDEKHPAESKLLADFMRSKERRFNFITPSTADSNAKNLYNTVIRIEGEDQNFDIVSSDNCAALEFFLNEKYNTGLIEDVMKSLGKSGSY